MGNNFSIVLVHQGSIFYEYINDCITQILNFNECEIFFISNETHKNKIYNSKRVNFIPIEGLTKTKKHVLFNQTKSYDVNFRDGFNKSVTERFFLIEELMLELSLSNVFHFENDNLIYTDLSEHIITFSENYNFASVFDNDQRCIPSFVYFKSEDSIRKLTEFIINSNGTNDMSLLSDYRYVSQTEICNLPILPDFYDLDLVSRIGHRTNNPKQYYHNFNKFESIFDAACIGQFLGGVDPRNSPGDSSGFINESSLFNPSVFNLSFEVDSYNRKYPVMSYKDKKFKLNNLHIHCKNLKKFM